jgi:hypothetical protein
MVEKNSIEGSASGCAGVELEFAGLFSVAWVSTDRAISANVINMEGSGRISCLSYW